MPRVAGSPRQLLMTKRLSLRIYSTANTISVTYSPFIRGRNYSRVIPTATANNLGTVGRRRVVDGRTCEKQLRSAPDKSEN